MDLFSAAEGVETPFRHFLSENVKKMFGGELEEKGCGSEQINEKFLVEQAGTSTAIMLEEPDGIQEPDGKRNCMDAKWCHLFESSFRRLTS